MKTVRCIVTRSHRHSMERIVEVGEVLDLPEHVAVERTTTGAVKVAPAVGEAGAQESGAPAGAASAAPAPEPDPEVKPVAAEGREPQPAEPPAAPEPATAPPAAPEPTRSGRGRNR